MRTNLVYTTEFSKAEELPEQTLGTETHTQYDADAGLQEYGTMQAWHPGQGPEPMPK